MKIFTLLKLIGAGILALLVGIFGLKQGKKSAEREVQKAEIKAAEFKSREQAAVIQVQEVVQSFKEEQQHHGQTKEYIQEFIEATEEIEEIQEKVDEKNETIINANIVDKLKFMRNKSTSNSEN